MRQIEREMVSAFVNGYNFSKSNTTVEVLSKAIIVRLHGNTIAIKRRDTGKIYFSLAGWNTTTTRSRLNALGCEVRCKNFTPIRNGVEWWGDWNNTNEFFNLVS